jgi:hypothetical protein
VPFVASEPFPHAAKAQNSRRDQSHRAALSQLALLALDGPRVAARVEVTVRIPIAWNITQTGDSGLDVAILAGWWPVFGARCVGFEALPTQVTEHVILVSSNELLFAAVRLISSITHSVGSRPIL